MCSPTNRYVLSCPLTDTHAHIHYNLIGVTGAAHVQTNRGHFAQLMASLAECHACIVFRLNDDFAFHNFTLLSQSAAIC